MAPHFTFIDTNGKTTTETYSPQRRGPDSENRDRPPPRRDEQTPSNSKPKNNLPQLTVTSPAFESNASIPIEFTGDGAGISPPIQWKHAPKDTKSFAVNVWHIPGPNEIKSYWVVYNIPKNVTQLGKNETSVGIIGINDKNRREYDPMKSKGPGEAVSRYCLRFVLRTENPSRKSRPSSSSRSHSGHYAR